MSLTEAMAFLGVTEDADVKAVKRAYHKLLKRHKPDSDPEGFETLRAAFVQVDEHLREREFLAVLGQSDAMDTDAPLEEEPSGPDSGMVTAAISVPDEPLHEVDPDAVQLALIEGDVDTALALVMDDRWAHAMVDDEDGSLGWITQRVSKMSVLANRAGYDALAERYPELTQGSMDEHVALLLLVSPDWEHLVAHEDVPPAVVDFVLHSAGLPDYGRRIELGRALAAWYWSDPAEAWRFLSATLSRRRALASYLAELLLDYDELVEEGTQPLPLETTHSPSRVLAPLTTPFMVLAVVSGVSTYIALVASISSAWGIVARMGLTALAVLVVMFLELLVYNVWPAMRRRYLHACMAVDTLPEDAAWSLTGHFLLRAAIAGDALMDMAFQVGRLGPPRPRSMIPRHRS